MSSAVSGSVHTHKDPAVSLPCSPVSGVMHAHEVCDISVLSVLCPGVTGVVSVGKVYATFLVCVPMFCSLSLSLF